jgi:recombination protein RecT
VTKKFEPVEEEPTGPADIETEMERASFVEEAEPQPEPPEPAAPKAAPKQQPVSVAPAVLVKATGKLATMRDALSKIYPTLAGSLPQGAMDPQRMYTLSCMAIERVPALLDCTVISVVRGILNAAQLGLDPTGLGGQAYLIPRKNKRTGMMEANFEIGYRGYINLMTRSGRVIKVVARLVRENDRFQLLCGSEERLVHAPCTDSDPGKLESCYAVATFANGMTQFEFMQLADVYKIRNQSQAYQAGVGPWIDHEEEMIRKTVTKKLAKYVPSDPGLDFGMTADDAAETGEDQPSSVPPDLIELAAATADVEAPEPPKAPRRGARG